MNRQVRRVGIAVVVCFLALFVQLNWLQVIDAHSLANNPRNVRAVLRDYAEPRGQILTSDGVGEWATMTVGTGERRPDGTTNITLLREIRFPHSLGMLYSTFTAYLGFRVNEDEYKVMGLAGYGRPTLVDKV